ncbi:MAG: response regulator [Desulfobulbaceae bacterium]|nr:response regulator [Desulfobulbaceae bacterium]HIJ78743.1 response regulator [Deltaproteobacteria bacterium]
MPKKILIIDDDQDIRNAIKKYLLPNDYEVIEATDGASGISKAKESIPDLILLDINMPDINGLEVCRKLRSDPKNIFSIIMLTANNHNEVEALENGADDYIVKPFQKEVLLARIRRWLEVAEQRHGANIDPLTGVFNRRTFSIMLTQEEERALRYNRPVSAVIMDIDHFKKVNDTYGHHIGDSVLAEMALILRETCRHSDLVVRWGGEEFAILLPETGDEEAIIFAEKARLKIAERSFHLAGHLTASFGVAQLRKNDEIGMMKRADNALYRAKEKGRNKVVVDRPNLKENEIISLLVVDDDESIRDLVKIKLMTLGYDVHTAPDGGMAFKALQSYNIDIVMIDQEMPGRDGMATYLAIKEEWPKLPVLMVTAHSSKHLITSFLTAGGRDFIEKPLVDFESLDFRIKRVLRELKKELETEEKLRQAKVREESQKIKNIFLASMSHELRTPLTHIVGFTQRLLNADEKPSNKQNDYLTRILAGANTLSTLVEDILEVTVLENNEKYATEKVFPQEAALQANQIIQNRLKTKGLSLDLSLPSTIPPVDANQQKLTEIFTKLLDNAIKFTEHGTITISAQEIEKEVVFAVHNTGRAIPETQLPHLFEPFSKLDHETGEKPGAGLGLYICRRLLELMNGKIWVKNDQHQGVTFFFSLNKWNHKNDG